MSGRDIYATDAANDNSNDYEFIEMTLGDCDACDAINTVLYQIRGEWICGRCAGIADDDEYERTAEDAARKADAATDWERT